MDARTTKRIELEKLTVWSLEGESRLLSEIVTRPTLLIFIRHLGCVLCQDHLVQVSKIKDWLAERGVDVVVISFAKPEKLAPYQQLKNWPFAMFADPDRVVYKEFDLGRFAWYQMLHPMTILRGTQLLFKGFRVDRPTDDISQAGGDFLVQPKGEMTFAFRSNNPANRPTNQQLCNAVEKLALAVT